MAKRQGLGRGLDALLGGVAEAVREDAAVQQQAKENGSMFMMLNPSPSEAAPA